MPRPGARRAALAALWLGASGLAAAPLAAQQIATAQYIEPTASYDHGILGDAIEYSAMRITLEDGRSYRVGLAGDGRVFEDVAPRLWDVTGDGAPEVVVIETDPPRGAQLAIYGMQGGAIAKIAATPHIGRTHRWLAPLGAADLDGDGHIELAYVDRPHLARVLRVWRLRDGALHAVAQAEGLTNHRIGWDYIEGGIRTCAGGPEMIAADAAWSRIMAAKLVAGRIETRALGAYSPAAIAAAMDCR